jgi:hypothetical protein
MFANPITRGPLARATVGTGLALAVVGAIGLGSGIAGPAADASDTTTRIYWDQNEEEDWLVHPGLQEAKPLIPAYDPNGQMCIFPGGSGSFTTAYNPTIPPNPGSTKPVMLPPVGEAVWDQHGNFTGKTIAVPGPYLGGDIPGNTSNPQDGSFNNNGTFTGCVVDPAGNLFADDLGNSQGSVPPTDSGRLVEWFAATNYTTYCIVFGPTANGTGPHHVDGTGGLAQPGTMARDPATGHVLVPVLGAAGTLHGEVLSFDVSSIHTAADCPGPSNMPTVPVVPTVFIDTTANIQPTPQGIALDPTDNDWAVSSVLVGTAVAWYTHAGAPDPTRPPVPGNPPPPAGPNTSPGYTPEGLAFAPDGTLYFADIHIVCTSPPTESNPTGGVGCGPATNQGQVMRVTFGPGEVPSVPKAVNTQPLNFPVSVTACTLEGKTVCPAPPGVPTK